MTPDEAYHDACKTVTFVWKGIKTHFQLSLKSYRLKIVLIMWISGTEIGTRFSPIVKSGMDNLSHIHRFRRQWMFVISQWLTDADNLNGRRLTLITGYLLAVQLNWVVLHIGWTWQHYEWWACTPVPKTRSVLHWVTFVFRTKLALRPNFCLKLGFQRSLIPNI